MQIRSATTAPTSRNAALKELYDRRQQELEAGLQRYDQLVERRDTAHEYLTYGMGTTFAGMGATVAGSLAKFNPLLYAGIGLTVAGLAVYAPALWIRNDATLDATFQRSDNEVLRDCQRDLAQELGLQR